MTTTQLHELLTTFAPDGVHVSRTRLFLILMSIHYRTQNQSRRVTATNLYNPRQHTTPNLLSILCTPWEDWVQTRSVDVLENFRFPAGILFQTTLKFVYCFLLRYYAESSGNFLPTFRENPFGPILKVQEHIQWVSQRVKRPGCEAGDSSA